ncbi:hypothetical protein FV242_09985 [Methylobacterium sp. WL64]|uniref:DUF5681 domain-containing protein n=1 Tax=Methylobacterium sp. WL64 TaxID=2603894 RepID=UPI0011C8A924|nr:DUF5681 domain-containing protein [Methylobacterium sp. WL64]TXN03826.1 hypothetical protein FV242_09985 [Methylobacterium sp. WL64]
MPRDRKRGEPPPVEATRVGYGCPPQRHRFKPNQVGNPWGRKGKPKPKGDFLDEIVVVQVAGKRQRLTRDETVDLALYKEVLAGNVSAAKELDRRRRERRASRPDSAIDDTLSLEDQAALDRLIARRAHGRSSPDEAADLGIAPDDEADADLSDEGAA